MAQRAACDDWLAPTTRRLIWIDRAALRLRGFTDRLSVPLALAAREFVDKRMWQVFGCARAEDHCRERHGRNARWLRDLAALGRALDHLPGLESALTGDDGQSPLGRTCATRLSRVATSRSVAAWIRLGRSVSFREFSNAVRQARKRKSEWPVEANEQPDQPALDPTRTQGADAPFSQVRMFVPGGLRVAFDEALTLHRAVSGHEVTVTDFVQALVAESTTGPAPADMDTLTLRSGRSLDSIEHELARVNDNWTWLDQIEVATVPNRGPRDREFDRLCRQSTQLLDALARITGPTPGTPAEIDLRIRELVRLENSVERLLGRMLRYMRDKRGWLKLRFGGVGQYASERLALGRRTAQDRSRAAGALRHLPTLREAYENDRIGLEAVLLVVRAIGPGPVPARIERVWVDRAAEVSVKRLRDEVRVAQRDWLLHGSWPPPQPLSDEEWQRSQQLFPGATQRRFSRLVAAVGSDRMANVETVFTLRLDQQLADDFLAVIEDRRRCLSDLARTFSVQGTASDIVTDARRRGATPQSAVAACRSAARGTFVPNHRALQCEFPLSRRIATTLLSRRSELPGWVGLMALLEEYIATWDAPPGDPDGRYAAIHARHGMRCASPLCTGRRNLEAHHVRFRSRGGTDAVDNLVTLCRFHHQRGQHGGLASCSGEAPLGLRWRLGRVDVAEWYTNERRLAPPDSASVRPAAS